MKNSAVGVITFAATLLIGCVGVPECFPDIESTHQTLLTNPAGFASVPGLDLELNPDIDSLYREALVRAANEDYAGLWSLLSQQRLSQDYLLLSFVGTFLESHQDNHLRTRQLMGTLVRSGFAGPTIVSDYDRYWRDVDHYDSREFFDRDQLMALVVGLYYGEPIVGNAAKTEEWFLKARNDKNAVFIDISLAHYLINLGNAQEALSILQRYESAFADLDRMSILLGLAHAQTDAHREAMTNFRSVWARNDTDHVFARVKTALYYLLLGNDKGAWSLMSHQIYDPREFFLVGAVWEPDFLRYKEESQAVAYLLAARRSDLSLSAIAERFPDPVDPEWLRANAYWPSSLVREYKETLETLSHSSNTT